MGKLSFNKRCHQASCRIESRDGYLPEFVIITEGKASDVEMGRTLAFSSGSIVVFDRGYNDYEWYNQLTEKGISLLHASKPMLNTG